MQKTAGIFGHYFSRYAGTLENYHQVKNGENNVSLEFN